MKMLIHKKGIGKGKSSPKFMQDFPKGTVKEVDQALATKLLIKKIKAGTPSSVTAGEYQVNQIK